VKAAKGQGAGGAGSSAAAGDGPPQPTPKPPLERDAKELVELLRVFMGRVMATAAAATTL
jgi:hypothetical protein